jgi:hypothetical protein
LGGRLYCKIHFNKKVFNKGIAYNIPIKIFAISRLVLHKRYIIEDGLLLFSFLESNAECGMEPKLTLLTPKKAQHF